MLAAEYSSSTQILKILIDNGALPSIRDASGKTAFYYASMNTSLEHDDIYWSLNGHWHRNSSQGMENENNRRKTKRKNNKMSGRRYPPGNGQNARIRICNTWRPDGKILAWPFQRFWNNRNRSRITRSIFRWTVRKRQDKGKHSPWKRIRNGKRMRRKNPVPFYARRIFHKALQITVWLYIFWSAVPL